MCTISISLSKKKKHVELWVGPNAQRCSRNMGLLRLLMRTIQIKSFCRKCYTIYVVNV